MGATTKTAAAGVELVEDGAQCAQMHKQLYSGKKKIKISALRKERERERRGEERRGTERNGREDPGLARMPHDLDVSSELNKIRLVSKQDFCVDILERMQRLRTPHRRISSQRKSN
jgi:hypothetical protein